MKQLDFDAIQADLLRLADENPKELAMRIDRALSFVERYRRFADTDGHSTLDKEGIRTLNAAMNELETALLCSDFTH